MKKRIAIIGASAGQLSLCRQAKEMGIETFCFAWSQDAVCKEVVDYFIPVSIFEMDKIVAYCRKYEVDGVVTNASERTALVASYVAEKLKLPCTPFKAFLNIQNKEYVRCKTNMMEGLGSVKVHIGTAKELMQSVPKPYVLKPVNGSAKRGVNFVSDSVENVIIPDDMKNDVFMAEQYIEGKEYSVESISYDGQHDVIQITEKISTSAPHFVELEHHQPAALSCELRNKIHDIIPKILTKVCFMNGASHTEIKIDNRGEVYLIEINPRGGRLYF